MYTKVHPYTVPLDIFVKLGERASELSDVDLGFIGGVIKKYRPKKIVEVGVSAGGTSAFILNCLDKLDLDSEVWSVDLAHTFHLDKRKECGYQIKPALKHLSHKLSHHLVLGKNIAQVLPDIAMLKNKCSTGGIDLLVLDTTHYLPGELLDFIVCLPYLSDNAIVICDDLCFWNEGENRNAIATRVLYSAIVARRLLPSNCEGAVKMAGIQIGNETRKSIEGAFESLSLPWEYIIESEGMKNYRDLVATYYEPELLERFDDAVAINYEAFKKKRNIGYEIKKLMNLFSVGKPVYIFGAGSRGQSLNQFFQDRGLNSKGFVISSGQDKSRFNYVGRPVFYLDELPERNEERLLILAVADKTAKDTLDKYECRYIEAPNYIFPFIKEYAKFFCV